MQGIWGRLPQREFFVPLMDYLEDSLDSGQTEDGVFNFKSINEHRGSYSPPDPEYLGNGYNLCIEWETVKITWEPLSNAMPYVKHCGKFKASLVADGNHTKEQTENVYL